MPSMSACGPGSHLDYGLLAFGSAVRDCRFFLHAVRRWGRSFAALGIDYRGAELLLDLVDRRGKYENGFMHGPVVAWRDRGREMAAEGLDKVASTVRRLSTDMQFDQPQIANVAMTAADQADKVAQYLRDTDARQIISNVEDTARRQPLIFIGGAFLLGLAAARLMKAGSPDTAQAGQFERRSGYRSGYQGSNTFEATGPGTGNGHEAS